MNHLRFGVFLLLLFLVGSFQNLFSGRFHLTKHTHKKSKNENVTLMLSTMMFALSCGCIAAKSAVAAITSDDVDKMAMVDGTVSAVFASTDDDSVSKSFRFILVENDDFPHQISDFFYVFCFVFFSVFVWFRLCFIRVLIIENHERSCWCVNVLLSHFCLQKFSARCHESKTHWYIKLRWKNQHFFLLTLTFLCVRFCYDSERTNCHCDCHLSALILKKFQTWFLLLFSVGWLHV